jgi:hypothetical protein
MRLEYSGELGKKREEKGKKMRLEYREGTKISKDL